MYEQDKANIRKKSLREGTRNRYRHTDPLVHTLTNFTNTLN